MKKAALILLLISLAAFACVSSKAKGPMASAVIEPRSGSSVTGTVAFTEQEGGVAIKIDLSGLTPGQHAIHLHEKGDCSAPDATSAGPHFNPTAMPHGNPASAQHHAGDWGNIVADAKGEVHTTVKSMDLTVAEGAGSVVGHAVVVHADPDDMTSQPAGNAGKRIGCGVVTLASNM